MAHARRAGRRLGQPGPRAQSSGRHRPRARGARGAPWALGALHSLRRDRGLGPGVGTTRAHPLPPRAGQRPGGGRAAALGCIYLRAPRQVAHSAPSPGASPPPLPAFRGGGGSSSSNMAVDGCSGWRWRREELPRAPAPAARC